MFVLICGCAVQLLSPPIIMKAISSASKQNAIHLLLEGYSLRQVQQKTGLGKSTVHRISKDIESDKENLKGGCPPKVSPSDAWQVVSRITSGCFDTATEAAKWLNTTLPSPIHPQTVANMLKKHNLYAGHKSKKPFLKPEHRRRHLKFAECHKEWTVDDWKRVIWSDETKISRLDCDCNSV